MRQQWSNVFLALTHQAMVNYVTNSFNCVYLLITMFLTGFMRMHSKNIIINKPLLILLFYNFLQKAQPVATNYFQPINYEWPLEDKQHHRNFF